MHNISIPAVITSALSLYLSVFSAYAADTPEKSENKGMIIAVLTVIFIAALVSSTFITYKRRVKKFHKQNNTDKNTSVSPDSRE